MTIENLQDKTIGIIGVGQEGQAVTRYLILHKIKPILIDQKEFAEWPEEIVSIIEEQKLLYQAGEKALEALNDCKVIFRSPGFHRLNPKLLEAEKKGTIVTSQTKWFFEHSPATIIGITGTKGKGTTTTLIFEILKAAKSKNEINGQVFITGNIGKEQPLDFLPTLNNDDLVAYELSSFQLQDLTKSPHVGISLMVTSDHLDHHADLDEYHEAKKAITSFQGPDDYAIYNADYPASVVIGEYGQGSKFAISAKLQPQFGASINDEVIQLRLLDKQMQINCQGRMLRGKHNLENIAAASLACAILGVDANTIEKTVKSFKGLEHRLEFVATKNGVSYYNDSIATVPETTMAAVNSFTEPAIVIVGGSDKGVPFDSLVDFLKAKENVKGIVLMGETGKTIKELLEKSGTDKTVKGPFQNFDEVMANAEQLAEPGDVVLLSPATASFDMFKNYADRGHQFVAAVNKI